MQAGKSKIEIQESDYEKQISSRVQTFDEKVQAVVAEGKQRLEDKLQTYHQGFEEKIVDVMDRLTKLVNVTIQDLDEKAKAGGKTVSQFGDSAHQNLAQNVDGWQNGISEIGKEYQSTLTKDRQSFEELHAVKLTQKVTEVKDEINKIAQEAHTKLNASHKLFYSSLKRLEKKYYERLERYSLDLKLP